MMNVIFYHQMLLTKEEADKLYQSIGSSQPSLNIWTAVKQNRMVNLYQKDSNTLYLIKG